MAFTCEAAQTSLMNPSQCSACLELLKDPRTLPCWHSFCKVCLEDIVKSCRDKAPDGRHIRELPCPNCHQTFTIKPQKQAPDIRQNPFIRNLVEEATILNQTTEVTCSHKCTEGPSVARCLTCKKFLCKECLTVHNKYRGHSNHSVLAMKELIKPENRKKLREKIYCNEHQDEILTAYCQTCDQLVCKECMEVKHTKLCNHFLFLVQNVAGSCKEKLVAKSQAMNNALLEGDAHLKKLLSANEQLYSDAANATREIIQQKESVIEELTKMVEQKAEVLLIEAELIYAAEKLKLERPTEEARKYVENLSRSVLLSKKLIDSGTDEEVMSSQKMMLSYAENLLKKPPAGLKESVQVAKLSYTPSASEPSSSEEIRMVLDKRFGEVDGRKTNIFGNIPAQAPVRQNRVIRRPVRRL
ncbi:transcription intermediary factor 1-beta-like [Dendronephthya gigantea]|uniref:transcription intermediary factor 1-beta-like n=1 Tax=Dendronephthya gigantea TaxID=151771 RepID=UPI00106A67D9|nr:transcription intermediary factor 1-beta-like [Dendronephthya gigantea]